MKVSHRTRTALAVLALATGLLGTALPAPALAAQTGPSARPNPNVPGPVQSGPTRADGSHRYDGKPPLPDVSVKVVGSSGTNLYPDHLDVAFNLQTVGADANNVALKAHCIYYLQNDLTFTRDEALPVKQVSLSASWPVPVPYLVTCVPDHGELVEKVTLTADVPGGDASTVNNSAFWDHISGPR